MSLSSRQCVDNWYYNPDKRACIECDEDSKKSPFVQIVTIVSESLTLILTLAFIGLLIIIFAASLLADADAASAKALKSANLLAQHLKTTGVVGPNSKLKVTDKGSVQVVTVTTALVDSSVSIATHLEASAVVNTVTTVTREAPPREEEVKTAVEYWPSSMIQQLASTFKGASVALKSLWAFGQIAGNAGTSQSNQYHSRVEKNTIVTRCLLYPISFRAAFNCNISFPDMFETVLSTFSIFSFDILPGLGMDCWLTKFDYKSKVR